MHFPILGRIAKTLLRLELPLILFCSVVLLVSYLRAAQADPVAANSYYSGALEYIFASLSVSLCSALLVDTVSRELTRERKD